MPSTIGITNGKNAEHEEKPLKDKVHLEVNNSPSKSKNTTPLVVVANGGHAQDNNNGIDGACEAAEKMKNSLREFQDRLKCLRVNDQVRELQTTLRDR